MESGRRKELLQAYAERELHHGVFVIRCAAASQAWTGGSQDLTKAQNRHWSQLRLKGHPNRGLQQAWAAHGEGAFTYEVLEELKPDDFTPAGFKDALKAAEKRWRETLGAASVAP